MEIHNAKFDGTFKIFGEELSENSFLITTMCSKLTIFGEWVTSYFA